MTCYMGARLKGPLPEADKRIAESKASMRSTSGVESVCYWASILAAGFVVQSRHYAA